jgi:hypothetical protein
MSVNHISKTIVEFKDQFKCLEKMHIQDQIEFWIKRNPEIEKYINSIKVICLKGKECIKIFNEETNVIKILKETNDLKTNIILDNIIQYKGLVEFYTHSCEPKKISEYEEMALETMCIICQEKLKFWEQVMSNI